MWPHWCHVPFLIVCRWNEINNMSHNRSFFAVELTNREESVQFQTVSLCRALSVQLLALVHYWILLIWKCNLACLDNVPLSPWCGTCVCGLWKHIPFATLVQVSKSTHKNALRCLSELHPFLEDFSTPNIVLLSVLCRKTWKPPNMCVGCVWPDSSSIRLTRAACKWMWF